MATNLINFMPTKKIGNYLYLDENNKKLTIPQGLFRKKINEQKIYNYNDIVNFELIEDGNSISEGGVGRAIVGGALFGGIGAIVGGSTGHKHKQTCTNLKIKITLNNINNPVEYITFINTEIKKDSRLYKSYIKIAQEIISVLQIICETNKSINISQQINSPSVSNIDELKKYKELLDCGAITEEEFEKKKKEILNLESNVKKEIHQNSSNIETHNILNNKSVNKKIISEPQKLGNVNIVVSWIFFAFFVLAAFGSLSSGFNFVTLIIYALMALICCPPIIEKIQEKINITTSMRIIVFDKIKVVQKIREF